MFHLQLFSLIYTRRVLTVGRGDAFVIFTPPGQQLSIQKRIITAVTGWLVNVLRSINPTELKNRLKEYAGKVEAIVKSEFGDSANEMMSLDGLATAPSKQGQGYGTALVRSVTEKANAEGRSTWLVSSNIVNTAFYEHCGFSIAGEFTLGETNPTWKKTQSSFGFSSGCQG